jgi:hypothetical protein
LSCVVAASILAFGIAAPARSATLHVCASGCTYSNLQPALDAAQPGDTILLRAGETFVGNYVLPAKSASSTAVITIRSDAPDSALPPDGVRLVPQGKTGANTSLGALARILGQGGTAKSLSVLRTAPGAHHYRLEFLEFDGTAQLGYETLIQIGTDKADTPPHDIVFDRVYVHGHPTKGQKRGIAMNGKHLDVLNSYISDIKSVNADSQALGSANGAGPFRIVNNYIEAAGENILFGGSVPATTGLIPSDIEISRNYIGKPLAWQKPILTAPTSLRAAASSASGVLASGVHYFKVVAVLRSGTTNIVSAASGEVSVTASAGHSVSLAWSGVSGAETYRIYRGTSAGGETKYMTTTGATPSFTYTGSGETSGTPPTTGSHWVAKNLFELKNAQRVTVDGNLFEHNWTGDQSGYAIVFTPRNTDNQMPWAVVRDVTFTNNILRHTAGAINILGYDDTAASGSQITARITIRNNLFYDIDPDNWGGGLAKCFQLGGGVSNVVIDRNTIAQDTTIFLAAYDRPMPGLVFTNNIAISGKYGVMGAGSSPGLPTLAQYFPGAIFSSNVIAGGNASLYPAGNFFPTMDQWDASFVDVTAGDYTILSTSVFYRDGSGGTIPGVDIGALLGGDGGTSDPPPSSAPPTAVAGGPYSATTAVAVTVNGSASTAATASIASYRWTWCDDILLQVSSVPAAALHGAWKKASVAGAATGIALVNPDANLAKVATPAAAPASYVDVHFIAAAGVPYYVWFRGKAQDDRYTNDSFYMQFSDAVDAIGRQFATIGTADAVGFVLEEGYDAGDSGWGWNDADYGGAAAPIYFASSGDHVLRLQPREDGIELDQIVISSAAYAGKRPGAVRNDVTPAPATLGTGSGVTASHRYAQPGEYPLGLVVTDTAGGQGSDSTSVIVSGGTTSGLEAVPGGPYQGVVGSAVAFDGSGSKGTVASATWRTFDEIAISGAGLADAARHGNWVMISDASAAGGTALSNPDKGAAKRTSPLASPTDYVDITFTAAAHVPYHLWFRMRAAQNAYTNDSIFVQFSDSTTSGGTAVTRIGSTGALGVVLEEGYGAGESGWGWNDSNYGSLAAPVYFATSGTHTLRIQQREDGPIIDQIVLSTGAYFTARPGSTTGDGTIIPVTFGTLTGLKPTHTYRQPGTYPLELSVADSAGRVSTATTTVTVR